jgi:hypothetical protein
MDYTALYSNTELFTTTTVRISNPTSYMKITSYNLSSPPFYNLGKPPEDGQVKTETCKAIFKECILLCVSTIYMKKKN